MQEGFLESNLHVIRSDYSSGISDLVAFFLQSLGPGGISLFYFVLLGLVCWGVSLVWISFDPSSNSSKWRSDRAFLLVVCLTVLWGRWPHFIDREYNPDESACLAAAVRTLDVPAPFVGGDVTTMGPLEVLPLTWPHFLGMTIDYGSARLFGLACCLVALVCTFLIGRSLTGTNTWPRAVVFTIAIYDAFFSHPQIVYYTSEMLPTGTIFVMLWLAVDKEVDRLSPLTRACLIGLLGSSIGFTKLQFAPLAAAVGIFYLVKLDPRTKLCWKATATMLASALLLPTILLFWVSRFESLENVWIGYIRANIQYTETVRITTLFVDGFADSSLYPMSARLKLAYHNFFQVFQELRTFCWMSTLCLIVGLIAQKREQGKEQWMTLGLAFGFLALSWWVIILPGNAFAHYLRAIFLPTGLVFMLLLRGMRANRTATFAFIGIMLLPFLYERYFTKDLNQFRPTPAFLFRSDAYTLERLPRVVKDTLRFAQVGEPVAVWGWSPRIFVEGHLKMASRDTIGERVLEPRFDQPYYRERYLKEFKESNPQVFVDTIGLYMYGDRGQFGWETFPELKKIIEENYVQVEQTDDYRIYATKKRVAQLQGRP